MADNGILFIYSIYSFETKESIYRGARVPKVEKKFRLQKYTQRNDSISFHSVAFNNFTVSIRHIIPVVIVNGSRVFFASINMLQTSRNYPSKVRSGIGVW